MSKGKIKLNHAGIRALLKSPEVEEELASQAARIAERCGKGYAKDSKQMPGRVVASVYTETPEAYRDNLHNNTILRALK